MSDWRYVEDFAAVDPRGWFRIIPVGKFSKFGRTVEITDQTIRDMVGNFRVVPPTRLPVNVEHMDQHGKVGDIANLRAVPGDGLYAMIDWTAVGEQLLQEQRFQYYSPEIIFGAQEYEGRMIKNILYGLALTNHPYFGNDTALFSTKDALSGVPGAGPLIVIDESQGDNTMDATMIAEGIEAAAVKLGLRASEPKPSPAPAPSVEEFEALKAEVTRLAQEKEAAELAAATAVETALFSARVDKFKAMLPDLPTLAEKFAAIADEALAEDLAQEFKALNAQQSTAALFGEIGTAGGDVSGDDAAKFEALIDAGVKAGKSEFEAIQEVAKEHPDWVQAYRAASRTRKGKG